MDTPLYSFFAERRNAQLEVTSRSPLVISLEMLFSGQLPTGAFTRTAGKPCVQRACGSGEFRDGIGQLKTNCPGRLREPNDEFWLRLGGEEKEHRIQKTELRMSNDEVRLPRRPQEGPPRNDAARVSRPAQVSSAHNDGLMM